MQIPSAAIELGAVDGMGRLALPLRTSDGQQIATLLVSRNLPSDTVERLRTQVVPSLEALVAIALRRDAIQAEAVETEGLRRSDDLKTALLRSVSHDLRTPVTAIVTAGHALAVRSTHGRRASRAQRRGRRGGWAAGGADRQAARPLAAPVGAG